MAHFAKIVSGKVDQVIVAEPDFFDSFVDSSPGEWIQTSYNTRGGVHYDPETNEPDGGVGLRKNFAGVGYNYDAQADAFYAPQPFPSWILNTESYIWEAPTPAPTDGQAYIWNEETTSWILSDTQDNV
jgi:hypothetical protein